METGEAQKLLVSLTDKVPSLMVKMMVKRRFGELSIYEGLEFDLISDLGFKNSMYSEQLTLNKEMYVDDWDRISAKLNYIQSDMDFYSNQRYYQQETEQIKYKIYLLDRLILIQALVFSGIIVIFASIYFNVFYRMRKTGRNFMDFLKFLGVQSIELKIKKNKSVTSTL